jgi:hypothetical protein
MELDDQCGRARSRDQNLSRDGKPMRYSALGSKIQRHFPVTGTGTGPELTV